jgi:mycothiol synthase
MGEIYMRIEALKNERIEEFIDYCKAYRREIDDSFLYDEDLKNFKADSENPTYIIVDDGDKITAAASIIVDEYMKRGRKGRFRIFHSSLNQLEHYRMLLEAVLLHTEGLDKIIVFSPIINEELSRTLEKLEFSAERYSYLLVREDLEVPEVILPEGYKIKPMEAGRDEEDWCKVRNASFAKLLGSETPMTPDMALKMILAEDFIEGGAMMLYHKGKPVGVARAAKDEYEDSPIVNIGPLAIIPEYQGKGLGRMLLRAAISFSRGKGYSRTILCVNAENERAKALYLQEGFNQVEAVACYKYDIELI